MNPIFKSCLIDSTRGSVDYTDDPYYDDNNDGMNASLSIYSSHSSSRGVLAPELGENMMRTIKDRDPYDVYVIAKLLGTGSMVRVCAKRIIFYFASVPVQRYQG